MKITLKTVMIIAMTLLISQSLVAKKLSTNLKAQYSTAEEISKKLKAKNFMIIGGSSVAQNNDYKILVVTHKELKKFAKKNKRGFAAVLRILINDKDKEVIVTNPEYFMRAFLQKDYKKGSGKVVRDLLVEALGELKGTKDKMSAGSLKGYHFMFGMPYYKEFQTVGKGTPDELLQRAKDSGRMLFKLNLSSGDKKRYLVGIKLPKKIEKFNKKLKTMKKSTMLPYMVLIEGKKAKIMHAKYFLAVSLPKLSMGQFMKIRSVPDSIQKSIKKVFKVKKAKK